MRFKRSEGLTPSEKLLAELCDKSFLKLWTYPNLFKKPGKELTDLLVVFGNDVIIFSDKSCGYPDTGDVDLDWKRWYRKSIADSAHQIAQAERWIRTCPDRVFLDVKCTEKLPIDLPDASEMRVHRVCVALGALDRAEAETGTRALKIEPAVLNDSVRFTVGTTDMAAGWVHVFDDTSLTIALSELSTITDFIHYLDSKVALMQSGNFKFADAETDILAYYLWNGRTVPAEEGDYRLEPDLWTQVESSEQFLAGREENKVSQFWDGLIEYINGHYLSETLEFGNEMTMSEHERTVRILAGETRFYRRVLSKVILQRREAARKQAISTLLPSEQNDVSYVLYVGQGDQGGDHAAYRTERAEDLQLRCVAAKAANPEKRFVIGIAMDAAGVKGSSEDFVFMDTAAWTAEEIQNAQKMRAELGYFKEGTAVMSRLSEDEYPRSRPAIDVPKLANELSGLTVSESLELAAMLKDRWRGPDSLA
ncbi:hypothetical protein [Bradyrhizobium sp. NC92]|uniref:hypothetical protein n=1 Tax=Bradyrhizobium sp. (strain NC92) TaxID=55395 RepID=UPI0021AA6BD2|nr:hypothetical protein [Bradyrhizobium sp. NC92]UWU66097.1 hypothetical protein N2602_22875 [Bradyrhizobium sp. NC92]